MREGRTTSSNVKWTHANNNLPSGHKVTTGCVLTRDLNQRIIEAHTKAMPKSIIAFTVKLTL